MEHTRAVEIDAVGRYLLGEMDPAERDDFEEHYFTCAECGEEVRLGAALMANARPVLAEQAHEPVQSRPLWWRVLPPVLAPAALALSAILIYQNAITIPALKREIETGRVVPSIVLHAVTRGADDVAHLPAGTKLFTLYFDLPAGAKYPTYRYTVADSSGRVLETITAAGTHEPWNLLLRGSRFPPGQYSLTVSGLKDSLTEGVVLAKYSFVME